MRLGERLSHQLRSRVADRVAINPGLHSIPDSQQYSHPSSSFVPVSVLCLIYWNTVQVEPQAKTLGIEYRIS